MSEFERMSDQIDQAQQINEAHQAASVEAARQKNRPEQIQNPDGTWPHTHCVECEDEIPAGRLALGKVRCVHCQEFLEKHGK